MDISIDNLPDRYHIPLLLNQLGLNGIGVELGVAKARYAKVILENSNLKTLYGIDMWGDRKHTKKEYRKVREEAKKWEGRFIVIRSVFSDAIRQFEDNFFDFIFVDGYAHKGNLRGATMKNWWPKLKPGGIMAIHDYTMRYPENHKAIRRWARKAHLTGYVTKERHKPSWVTQKPL